MHIRATKSDNNKDILKHPFRKLFTTNFHVYDSRIT